MVSQVDTPRLYERPANATAMHDCIRSSEGEHVIAASPHFLALAELGSNPGLVDGSTDRERERGGALWVELSVTSGASYHLGSAGWAGVYAEFSEQSLEDSTLRTLFDLERVLLDAQAVESYRQPADRFFVVGDVACGAFAPRLAQGDTTRWKGDAVPDYKRHLDVQHNRGLLLMAEMRKVGLDPIALTATQEAHLQVATSDRVSRLRTLVVRGGIAPVVANILGWDNPTWLDLRFIAPRVKAFELDAKATTEEVLETLMTQVENDEEMKATAGSQANIARTAGGSSDRYIANTVTNAVDNLFGIK